jgi:hypothetical protein
VTNSSCFSPARNRKTECMQSGYAPLLRGCSCTE